MLYRLENGRPQPEENGALRQDASYFGVFGFPELPEAAARFSLHAEFVRTYGEQPVTSYTLHEDTGYLLLHAFAGRHKKTLLHACACIRKGLLLVFCKETAEMERLLISFVPAQGTTLSRMLCNLIEKLTDGHVELHHSIELEVAELENALLTTKKRDCVREIIGLRRRMMDLKRFYEQLLAALDEMEENENDMYDEHAMRYFRLYSTRVDRLYHSALNLRDYVTQVRESYQAEVDISLNNIMKIFTVVTSIFLPLTLIVGWYGMNLRMPELAWPWMYPAVILISAA
ncbi:MAG TPA: CorA family divalent cation transporter, partial [Feifaniaceae bacterium]|nr:CorA family divalent cation transporter [Feifaniaceae bacterium]